MRRTFLTLAFLSAAVSAASGDGIILTDGRKLSGRVVEKADGYEVTVEGQTVGFTKAEAKQWFKSPKEVLGDADYPFRGCAGGAVRAGRCDAGGGGGGGARDLDA